MQTIKSLNEPIINFMGEKMIDGNSEADKAGNKEPLTAKKVMCRGLLTATPEGLPGDQKAAIDILCRTIWEAGDEVELESADVTKVRDAVGQVYPPTVVGPVFGLLK